MKQLLFIPAMLLILISCKETTEKPMPVAKSSAKTITHCAPKTTDADWYSSGTKAPLFDGLSGIDFRITTKSREAQQYFNQGMMLSYGFNHAEAARSFYEATRLDSTCAMAYWGYAYVLGPNYNAGMEADNFERAYAASEKARSLSGNSTQKEKALIAALAERYSKIPPANRSHLDSAFSKAMTKVYQQYPDDPDIGALYAESILDLHPWDLYDKKTKTPRSWTPEIVSVLEKLMKQYPRHPGAPHFYIHAMEASANPELALKSAKLLDTLVRGSGHLLHMSSHIYIWTGDYHAGTVANLEAVKADSSYLTACHAQGAYPLSYYPHNYHYLSATATFEGNSTLAWLAANKVQANVALDIMTIPGWGTLQHYFTVPYYVAVKFSKWDHILQMPEPADSLVYPRAIWHYAKGMAYLGKGDTTNSQAELQQLSQLAADTVLKTLTIWGINNMKDITDIAVLVLSAEISHQKKKYEESVKLLKNAIVLEDGLNYDEPPDWFFSVRHHLGKVLLDAGRYKEAETVYRQDLDIYTENGWSLKGLSMAYLGQHKQEEADKTRLRFERAWRYADMKLNSSSPF